jgi:hypothetical protein
MVVVRHGTDALVDVLDHIVDRGVVVRTVAADDAESQRTKTKPPPRSPDGAVRSRAREVSLRGHVTANGNPREKNKRTPHPQTHRRKR